MTAYEMRISDWSSDVCSSDLTFLSTIGHKRASKRSGVRLDDDRRRAGKHRRRRREREAQGRGDRAGKAQDAAKSDDMHDVLRMFGITCRALQRACQTHFPRFSAIGHVIASAGTQLDCPETGTPCTRADKMTDKPEFDLAVVIDDDEDILTAAT